MVAQRRRDGSRVPEPRGGVRVRRTKQTRRETLRNVRVVSLMAVFSIAVVAGGTVLLSHTIGTDGRPGSALVTIDARPAPRVAGASAPVAALPTAATPPSPLPREVDYVALGDSYAAGLDVAPQRSDQPACGRSTDNAASLLAARLEVASFVDVSCAGASTADFTGVQDTADTERPDPQRDALSRSTDLVTVTLGGNDFDIFGKLIGTCVRVASLDPDGAPCRDSYAGAGVGENPLASAGAVVDNLAAVLDGIVEAAPSARVVVIGYPRFIAGRTCGAVGFTVDDAEFATDVFDDVDGAMAQAAADADVEFVDVRQLAEGHDICSSVPWFSGFQPTAAAPAAWHPGADYYRALAQLLADRLDVS